MTTHTHRLGGQTLTHSHGEDEVGAGLSMATHGYFGHIEDGNAVVGRLEPPVVTADNLNSLVDWDCPFRVAADGTVTLHVEGLYAPSVYHVEGAQTPDDVDIQGAGWEAWSTGYTGQHGYHGAVLHASEQLAGGIATDLLAQPGIYAITGVEVMPEDDDDEPEPAGWIILRKTP